MFCCSNDMDEFLEDIKDMHWFRYLMDYFNDECVINSLPAKSSLERIKKMNDKEAGITKDEIKLLKLMNKHSKIDWTIHFRNI